MHACMCGEIKLDAWASPSYLCLMDHGISPYACLHMLRAPTACHRPSRSGPVAAVRAHMQPAGLRRLQHAASVLLLLRRPIHPPPFNLNLFILKI